MVWGPKRLHFVEKGEKSEDAGVQEVPGPKVLRDAGRASRGPAPTRTCVAVWAAPSSAAGLFKPAAEEINVVATVQPLVPYL